MKKALVIIIIILIGISQISATVKEETFEEAYPTLMEEATRISKAIYGEGNYVSLVEKACIAWCIYNCCDYYNMKVEQLVQPNYYLGYDPNNPVTEENFRIAFDVALGHWIEQQYGECPNRVLPKEYKFFGGHDGHNWFRVEFEHFRNYWDYSLPNPYEGGLPEYNECN